MKIETIIEENVHHLLLGIKTEYDGDRQAADIIRKYIAGGTISVQEDEILRTQVMDSLKIVGIGIPFVLIPGASILMPIILKIASRYNIDLTPSDFEEPKKMSE